MRRPAPLARAAAALAVVAVLGLLAAPAEPRAGSVRVPQDVRAISYFPAQGGWTLMWSRFDAAAVARDFRRIAWLRANTVRVIVPPHAFGYPQLDPAAAARLERVVALAAANRLLVQLTLFDWWHDYQEVEPSKRWAGALLARYAGDPRIAFVELKNELDPGDAAATAWAAELLPHVRRAAGRPVTISVPAVAPAEDLARLRAALGPAQPDFYSAHVYYRPGRAATELRRARDAVAPVPLRIGETGYSTDLAYDVVTGVPATRSAREAQQGYYLRSLALTALRLGLPPIAPWILSDFAPGAIPADDASVHGSPREYRFGLYRVGGQAKPAAAALRAIFGGGRSYAFNNGFEQAVAGEQGRPVPALWRIRAAPRAVFLRDDRVARTGRASARIDGSAAGSGPDAAFTIAPPDPAVRRGDRSTATAWSRATARCGDVRLRLVWHDRDGAPVKVRDSRPLRCGTPGWQRLEAAGLAPGKAVSVELELRAVGTRGSAWFDDAGYTCARGRGRC